MYPCRECGTLYDLTGYHPGDHRRLLNGSTKVDCKDCYNHKTMMAKRKGRAAGAQWTQDYYDRLQEATPKWTTDEYRDTIKEKYASREADDAIDHEIPIQGERASGLHVPDNLQVMNRTKNLSKSNTWNPMNEIIMHQNDDGTYTQEVVLN